MVLTATAGAMPIIVTVVYVYYCTKEKRGSTMHLVWLYTM